jgi:hypothetical protein
VYRAPLGGADFALHVSGESGAGKTELAALCQQHYGAEMVARHLPGSWSSTANALERIAFAAKDALLVVDDFCPQGAGTSAPALLSAADRLLRAQGNRSGRHRLGGEGMLRLAAPPRELILSTGEELPKGLSLRARIVAVEVALGDVDWSAVTACQKAASEGGYVQALAAFVRWVAGKRAAVLDSVRQRTESLRAQGFGLDRGHKRSLGNLASLVAAWEVFVSFAAERGAAGAGEAEALGGEARAVFDALAKEQAEVQLARESSWPSPSPGSSSARRGKAAKVREASSRASP